MSGDDAQRTSRPGQIDPLDNSRNETHSRRYQIIGAVKGVPRHAVAARLATRGVAELDFCYDVVLHVDVLPDYAHI